MSIIGPTMDQPNYDDVFNDYNYNESKLLNMSNRQNISVNILKNIENIIVEEGSDLNFMTLTNNQNRDFGKPIFNEENEIKEEDYPNNMQDVFNNDDPLFYENNEEDRDHHFTEKEEKINKQIQIDLEEYLL
jgi:hypothetical protein